jgi:fatty acid desaturase
MTVALSSNFARSARVTLPVNATARFADDAERMRSFGAAIDAIRRRAEAKVGVEDVRHVKRLRRLSRAFEVAGRVLLHVSLDPVTFGAGVFSLWLHKQLEATEIGHTALHGAYDRLPGAEAFESKRFHWAVPIDEESWRIGHNQKHHGFTNVAGKDPDIHYGPVRLTEHTPHRFINYFQVPIALGVIWPSFAFLMNIHFTGLNDFYFGSGRGRDDVLPDRSFRTIARAHWLTARKYIRYYAKEFVLFPLLAGPGFAKVLLGNWMSEVMRDLYSAATIWCGHIGEDVAAYPEGTTVPGRAAWYAMQVESSNDFEVPYVVSVLCGGLDRQIEHHLFPRLPPDRLREIAPEVRAVCESHGVRYRTASWPRTLLTAFKHLVRLSRPTPAEAKGQPRAAAQASQAQPTMSDTPPMGVTAPSHLGAPSASA